MVEKAERRMEARQNQEYDSIREPDGMIGLMEAPPARNFENMTHAQLIDLIRKCPRSNFFAYSQANFNVHTMSQDEALNELSALTA